MFWVSFYDAQLCSLDSYLLFVRFLSVTIHHHGKLAQFTNLVLILTGLRTELRYSDKTHGSQCLLVSEDQSWLSRSQSGTCLSLWVTPGHWHCTGPSLVSASHWSPGLTSGLWLVSDGTRFCCGSPGDSVVRPRPRVPPTLSLEWGVRHILREEYTLIMRPREREHPDTPESGRLTTQFMAPVSFAAPASRNFGYLIIGRRNIPSQVSKMIMNYPSLETGASNKQRNCLHFSVCIYSFGQTRNKCSNSIKVSRKCNRSPSFPSPQQRIDCLLQKIIKTGLPLMCHSEGKWQWLWFTKFFYGFLKAFYKSPFLVLSRM